MRVYRTRDVRIASYGERPYCADEWRDALVIVRSGVLELVSIGGVRRRFGPGSMLFLDRLRVRGLRNPDRVATVLSAVTRATSGLSRSR